MVISINAEEAFDKIQYFFLLSPGKTVHSEEYLKTIKAILIKPTDNIKLDGEKLKEFLLKIRNKTGFYIYSIYLDSYLEE